MVKKEKIEGNIRAVVIHPHFRGKGITRTPEEKLEEAVGLALALELDVVHQDVVNMREVTPATLLGKGKVEELREIIANKMVKIAIVDSRVSPTQQKNLEKIWKCKVFDRTALIIEIFASRAKTGEGKLQVELASLNYQKGRLVRMWTHLERQRGGFGFLGGPGEAQIELDRRKINDKISKIKGELEVVRRTRALHRKSRSSVPYPIIALVGYTNAGKSTLFNQLTDAKVIAEDMLFATLDPTMRVIHLPSKKKIILSDTVGFISDLPTELIAAFRATLEEVIEADIILHVRDISSTMSVAEKLDVEQVLTNLGIKEKISHQMIEVLNKIDLLPKPEQKNLIDNSEDKNHVAISALEGAGIQYLLKIIDRKLAKNLPEQKLIIDSSNGKLLSWIYENAENVERKDKGKKIHLTFKISEKNHAHLKKILGG